MLFLLHGIAMLIVQESSGSGNKPKTQRRQRHAMLLFVGGPWVRKILKKLHSSVESDSDKQAPDNSNSLVEILNNHFVVRRFMRHVLGDSLKISIANFICWKMKISGR